MFIQISQTWVQPRAVTGLVLKQCLFDQASEPTGDVVLPYFGGRTRWICKALDNLLLKPRSPLPQRGVPNRKLKDTMWQAGIVSRSTRSKDISLAYSLDGMLPRGPFSYASDTGNPYIVVYDFLTFQFLL